MFEKEIEELIDEHKAINKVLREFEKKLDNFTVLDAENLLNFVLTEVDGHPKALEDEIVEVAKICEMNGAKVEVAKTDREAEKLWEARRSLSPAVAKLGRTK
jgi:FAD linked oxidases, C-terminal domain.